MSGIPSDRPTLRRALPGLLFVLLVVAVHSPTLFSRRNFAGRDLLVYHLPIEKSVHDAYSRGSLPIWISEISGGRPLAANPNVGAFYPIRPLLAFFPFPVAMRIFPVLHWIIAGLGMMVLLRSLGASPAAAWVGATTYTFSGVGVTEVFFPNIHPGMALLPWVPWAVQRRGASAGNRLLVLSLLLGLLFFAGDVFTIGMAILAALLWNLLEVERPERWRGIVLLGASLVVAALLSAPQVIASALWIPDTNRAVLGMRLRDALSFSVSPLRLLELVVPFPFGPTWSLEDSRIWGWPVFGGKTVGFFTTFYAGALSLIALASCWRWRLQGARFARVLFLVALAAAVLPRMLPEGWLGLPSPLPLRFPEKFAVGFVLALSLLAGLAIDRFRLVARRLPWIFVVGGILAAVAAVCALVPDRAGALAVGITGAGPDLPRLPEAPRAPAAIAASELPIAIAEGALLWVATVTALELLRRPGKGPLAAALVLLTAVPIASNRRIARTLTEEAMFRPDEFARFLERADPNRRYRALGESFYRGASPMEVARGAAEPEGGGESWVQYRQALFGRGTVFNFDFDAGDSARLQSLRTLSLAGATESRSRAFFGNLALRWGIRFRDQAPLPGYEPIGRSAVHHWDELREALPDIRLVRAWQEVTGPLQAAQRLLGLEVGEVVLETGSDLRGRSADGSVRVIQNRPERIVLDVDARESTWLFVLRGFWNYRTVLLDGKTIEPFPAQLAFSAVAIPAGRHTIDWREQVPGLEVSRYGPLVAAGLLALLLIRDRRRRNAALMSRIPPDDRPTVRAARFRVTSSSSNDSRSARAPDRRGDREQ